MTPAQIWKFYREVAERKKIAQTPEEVFIKDCIHRSRMPCAYSHNAALAFVLFWRYLELSGKGEIYSVYDVRPIRCRRKSYCRWDVLYKSTKGYGPDAGASADKELNWVIPNCNRSNVELMAIGKDHFWRITYSVRRADNSCVCGKAKVFEQHSTRVVFQWLRTTVTAKVVEEIYQENALALLPIFD